MRKEARKQQDLCMHIAKLPSGPRAKLHVQNLHTMSELNSIGNSSKRSRPILSFDAAFENDPHLRLLRELQAHTFGVPRSSRKAKPFIDRVLAFHVVDSRVWVRHYQVGEEDATDDEEDTSENKMSLVEIGPRFCLIPIFTQEGSFAGPIIYQNKCFVSPNQVRADIRRSNSDKHGMRKEQFLARSSKKEGLGIKSNGKESRVNPLDTRSLFA
ncbi:Ribosome biogenesis protein BRX1 [Apiospora kogelbergensis]|uniref:Ribosome biogenesis protein BRX1 n=1 Tax=Apiospora kogelbergensis TaxID=1337665 RepID=UPI0031310C57